MLKRRRGQVLFLSSLWIIGANAAFLFPGVSRAQSKMPEKNSIHFQGELRRGEKFEKEIGEDLVFRLVPDEFGWDIEVGPAQSEEDFTDCVNMPIHGITPRQIRGWHFRSDDNSEALKPEDFQTPGIGTPREFDFVLNSADDAKSCDDLGRIAHGNDEENPEHKKAMARWGELVGGTGSLTITDFTLGNLKPGTQAWIELMKFDVSISIPPKPGTRKTSKSK